MAQEFVCFDDKIKKVRLNICLTVMTCLVAVCYHTQPS